MENRELKKCPFCGCKVKPEQNYIQQISVKCDGCGVKVFFVVNDVALRNIEDVINAWNRRANDGT